MHLRRHSRCHPTGMYVSPRSRRESEQSLHPVELSDLLGRMQLHEASELRTSLEVVMNERWIVYGIPTFITKQVDPGTVIAFTMVYEPNKDREDRYRITAVKVVNVE
jgi:hypothetical protein